MNTITIDIPEAMMQMLQSQNEPLQSLLLEALNEYFDKKSLAKSKIGGLCDSFEIIEPKSNGQKMAEALKQISVTYSLSGLNPQEWQRENRGDRPFPDRD